MRPPAARAAASRESGRAGGHASAMWHALPLSLAVLAALELGACSSTQGRPAAPVADAKTRVRSAVMTSAVPSKLKRVCRSAERKSRAVRVACPGVLPAGLSSASVLLPRRSVVRPGAQGDDGRRRYRGSRAFYVIEGHSSALRPERHWLTGAGAELDVENRALASSERPSTQRRTVSGRTVEVRRYPPYPEGGINGGHVVALAREAGGMRYVSVHGWHHEDVAIAMLLDQLRP